MLGLVLATSVSTNTLVQGIGRRMDQNFELMHQEMHQIVYAAIAALLLPLQSKVRAVAFGWMLTLQPAHAYIYIQTYIWDCTSIVIALLFQLELLEQRTADHTTEDARNKNRKETDKTGGMHTIQFPNKKSTHDAVQELVWKLVLFYNHYISLS
jgi:hypothetical protein